MWAIKNRRTGKWLYGTCFGYPTTQRTSFEKAMLFEDYEEAQREFERRKCGDNYKICLVKLEEARTDEVCGHWIECYDKIRGDYYWKCSVCGDIESTDDFNFCPACGANNKTGYN